MKNNKNENTISTKYNTDQRKDLLTMEHENNKLESNNFLDEYRLKNERRKYLIDLQKKYKSGVITENDMSREDLNDLINLYIEQNMELKRKIKSYEMKMKQSIQKCFML